ncbi:MAG: cytidyltransferase [Flavobacteriales bacterium]|nr:cytidyltransferase [Flavobacteriales bacterium]|tara:strand:- start:2380 stop:2811 length:432 start_codon:yes stop_codon:yes gene_type:complete
MKFNIVIVSGYFNPLHKGHIEYFHNAKQSFDKLFVIVNNDSQRKLKNSKEFMLQDERKIIVNELKIVDEVFISIDYDRSVCKSLTMISKEYSKDNNLFFANGGDQNNKNIPESQLCNKLGIKLVDGLGEKIQSSSWLLKKDND